jgi:hypothetical protein
MLENMLTIYYYYYYFTLNFIPLKLLSYLILNYKNNYKIHKIFFRLNYDTNYLSTNLN